MRYDAHFHMYIHVGVCVCYKVHVHVFECDLHGHVRVLIGLWGIHDIYVVSLGRKELKVGVMAYLHSHTCIVSCVSAQSASCTKYLSHC